MRRGSCAYFGGGPKLECYGTDCINLTIGPTSYALLQKAQSTSAAVERSFSMLSKLVRKDRNFDVKNVKKYMMLFTIKSPGNYTVWLSLKTS